MNEAQILEIARAGIWTMVTTVGPLLLVAMAVGLSISLFQTLTQLQEMTLIFVPKIVATFIALIVLIPYMLNTMNGFALRMFDLVVALE